MFIDARSLPDQGRLEADLAIVGGGPAGITLARAFAGSSRSVCLVEAGGRDFDPDVQQLYDGVSAGIPYPLMGNRLRFLGGSSNHWGGFCRPLDPIDFEVRDWVPYSGWPFTIDELAPYYGPASELVEVGAARFTDRDYWERSTGEALPAPATGRLRYRFVQFSPPTRFGSRYGDQLAGAANVRVLLNANVTEIAAAPHGRSVDALEIRTLNGRSHRVRARTYVLATGGLENARLLLLSDRVVRGGLGNEHDLVGRFFMEHPHLHDFADLVVGELARLPAICRRRIEIDGRFATAAFNASDAFMRERRLLNATFMAGEAATYPSAKEATWANARAHQDMLRAARHFLTDGAPSERIGHWLGLGAACEQVPNPDSRVTLADERDALGLRRIRLDWRLTAQDRRSIVEHVRSLALELGALGIGRTRIDLGDPASWPELVSGGAHHMGTTRMHDDPRQGVVDRNCRVHGIDNLYVAGSSVFPTCGSANPTLTLVALALRLADHLRSGVHARA